MVFKSTTYVPGDAAGGMGRCANPGSSINSRVFLPLAGRSASWCGDALARDPEITGSQLKAYGGPVTSVSRTEGNRISIISSGKLGTTTEPQLVDPRLRHCAPQLIEGVVPNVRKIDWGRDRAVELLLQCDILLGGGDIGLVKAWVSRMWQDLVDAAPKHDVAADKQSDDFGHRSGANCSEKKGDSGLHSADLEIFQ
jgi:hypothetical protein